MKQVVVGVAWYEPEDYPRALEVMADADELPATYDAWRRRAENVEKTLELRGYAVARVRVEPDAFVGWCLVRGFDPVGDSRSRFASEAVEQQSGKPRVRPHL